MFPVVRGPISTTSPICSHFSTVPKNARHFFFGRLSYSPLQTSFMEAQNHMPHAGTLRSCHAHFVSPPRDITSPRHADDAMNANRKLSSESLARSAPPSSSLLALQLRLLGGGGHLARRNEVLWRRRPSLSRGE